MSPTTDRDDDLRLAIRAVAAAGRAVMAAFRTEQEVRHKSPSQPVTDADLEANRVIESILCEHRRDYGWLSEETKDQPDRLERRRVWIVDPIDGTRSFIAGYAEFGISIGLAEAGEAVLGVVHNPATRELFWAARGRGAFLAGDWDGTEAEALEGRRLSIADGTGASAASPAMDGRRGTMVASRSEIRRGELEPFREDWDIRPLGSSAYKLVAVAAGWGDALVSRGPKHEWDLAGAAVIVEEAGGRISDVRGEPLKFNRQDTFIPGLVAARPDRFDALLERTMTLPAPRLEPGYDDVIAAEEDE